MKLVTPIGLVICLIFTGIIVMENISNNKSYGVNSMASSGTWFMNRFPDINKGVAGAPAYEARPLKNPVPESYKEFLKAEQDETMPPDVELLMELEELGNKIKQFKAGEDEQDTEIAVEIEASATHPEQVIRNYEKNAKVGRFVVFVVPDEKIESKVKECLKNVGKKRYRIYIIK